MSWDIVLFKLDRKIVSVSEIEETMFVLFDFDAVFADYFSGKLKEKGNHREIQGGNYSIDYFTDDELVSNKLLHLYGKGAFPEIVKLCKAYHWQIYDTGIDEMIDLDNPENNGYDNFENYLNQILKSEGSDES